MRSALVFVAALASLAVATPPVPTVTDQYTATFNVTTPQFPPGAILKFAVLPGQNLYTIDAAVDRPNRLCIDSGLTAVAFSATACDYNCNRGHTCPNSANCQVGGRLSRGRGWLGN